jgi:membrane protease YdiL (CAAX protease family)
MSEDYLKLQLLAHPLSSVDFATLHSMFESPFVARQHVGDSASTSDYKPRIWRWLLGTAIIVIFWQAGGVALILAAAKVFGVPVEDLETFPDVAPWKAAFITLISFVPLFFVVPFLYRLLLQLPFKRLITSREKVSFRRIWHGFIVMSALIVPLSAIDLFLNGEDYRYTFDLALFWPYLIIALTLLPIQTTAEEFFFRGWLLRWVSSGRLPVWLVVFINSSLFALPHMFNPEVKDYYLIAFIYFTSMGAMLTIATLRDKSLELAIGAHFANNFLTGVLVSYQDSALPSAALLMSGELDWIGSTVTAVLMVPLFLWLTRPRVESEQR